MQPFPFEIREADLNRRFDRAAATFESASFAHRQIADGVFERLAALNASPRRVLDLGCGTGYGTALLAKRYRKAEVLAVDSSRSMLGRIERGWFSKIRRVNADARRLPLPDHCVDLAYSNLLLPWLPNPDPVFQELSRVLSREAPFVFSTLGPDSFATLRDAFADVDDKPRVNAFADMHDIGDGLVRAGLRDPVLDVDRLTVTYKDHRALFADLSRIGARNSLAHRRRGLLGRRAFAGALERLQRDGQIAISLEIIYGHAFGGGQSPGEFRIDAGQVPLRRAKNS